MLHNPSSTPLSATLMLQTQFGLEAEAAVDALDLLDGTVDGVISVTTALTRKKVSSWLIKTTRRLTRRFRACTKLLGKTSP